MVGPFLQAYRLVREVVLLVRQPNGRALALLLVLQLVGGTVSCTSTEGWSWLDALYFSATTPATVGLGDLAPVTAAGTLSTVVSILTGVGLLATSISMLAQQLRPAPGADRD
ncbi:potassium channel family protein [Geodermatophilus sp. SYSU D00779]